MADPIKSTTPQAIRELHAFGLNLVMITGDNLRTAEAVAKRFGIDRVEPEVEPQGKIAHVQKLHAGKVVATAGDGANDAPALDQADVGIAWAPAPTWQCRAPASHWSKTTFARLVKRSI